MADDEIPAIELGEGEVELMVFVATTKGVHAEAFPILGTLDIPGQVAVAREIAAQLRHTADGLEARAGLAQAIDDVEEAMRP